MTHLVEPDVIDEMSTHFYTRDDWRNWTPTVTQGVAITVSITYAKYLVFGNLAIVTAGIALQSAGTAANAIQIGGVPSTIASAQTGNAAIGHALVVDVGTQFYAGVIRATLAQSWQIIVNNGNNALGINPALTIANGDIISFYATYER